MHWTEKHIAAAIGIGLATIVPVSGLNAGPIVIKYEGRGSESYKPGKKLIPNAKISLKAGEIVTILDERGTRILRGPGTFSSSSSASVKNVSNTSLAALITTSSVRRARTGAVRGDGSVALQAASPNLWFVDVAKSGKVCVADFNNLQLWRSNAEFAREITTTDVATGTVASTQFGKGQMTVRWPATMMPANGKVFAFTMPGKAEKASARIVQVALTGEERLDTMAATLIENGCQIQAELLAARFMQAEPAPAGG